MTMTASNDNWRTFSSSIQDTGLAEAQELMQSLVDAYRPDMMPKQLQSLLHISGTLAYFGGDETVQIVALDGLEQLYQKMPENSLTSRQSVVRLWRDLAGHIDNPARVQHRLRQGLQKGTVPA